MGAFFATQHSADSGLNLHILELGSLLQDQFAGVHNTGWKKGIGAVCYPASIPLD